MNSRPVIVWFRQDLRLDDHPALQAALSTGSPLILLYILEENNSRPLGGASRWWLHESLSALEAQLAPINGSLTLRKGSAEHIIPQLIEETKAHAIYWNRRYDTDATAIDQPLKKNLRQLGISCHSFNGHLLFEPWTISNKQGKPFQVFTPFWRHCQSQKQTDFTPFYPRHIPIYLPLASDKLALWNLQPTYPDWAHGFRKMWEPGAIGAKKRLCYFLENGLSTYHQNRNFPGQKGTSFLSPHLRWGEISVRQLWQAIHIHEQSHFQSVPGGISGADCFRSEIGWREFSYHLLYHYPHLTTQPLRPQFQHFPWLEDNELVHDALIRWQSGTTGYPLIDAGMRQLWCTGWMHNRVRMVVASFLVKDLLVPWQQGEAWFWDTLVDADTASNSAGWQWVAGCGADAAPYFRVFNPTLQSMKFDPTGDYIREWIPELRHLNEKDIHAPEKVSSSLLNHRMESIYPTPMIDHDIAKKRALTAYQTMRDAEDS